MPTPSVPSGPLLTTLSSLSCKSSWSWKVELTLDWLREWSVTLQWTEFLIRKATRILWIPTSC